MSRGQPRSSGTGKPANNNTKHEKITQEYVVSVIGEPSLERSRPTQAQIETMVANLRELLPQGWDNADLLRLLDRYMWDKDNALHSVLEGVVQKGEDWTEHQSKAAKKKQQQKTQPRQQSSRGRGGRGSGGELGADGRNSQGYSR